MVEVFVGFLLVLGCLGGVLWLIARTCGRNPALRRHLLLLVVIGLSWCGFAIIRQLYLQQVFPPQDAIVHEAAAREIAESLAAGDPFSAPQGIRPGNAAYRWILGIFYFLTRAPELVVSTINAVLAFWALLSLLELTVRKTASWRIPAWFVVLVCGLPSALFWTTSNLKEGAMLWGISMFLRISLRFQESIEILAFSAGDNGPTHNDSVVNSTSPGLILPLAGLLVAILMRPHIALAWLLALGLGYGVWQKRLSAFSVAFVGAGIAFLAFQILAPEVLQRFEDQGLVATLESRYNTRAHIGSSNIRYTTGAPVPLVTGLELILLRPFPTEVFDIRSLAASLETWSLLLLLVYGWTFVGHRVHLLRQPLVVSQVCAMLLLSFHFSYMYNLGLLVRQRVQVLPALLLLIGLPILLRRRSRLILAVSHLGESPLPDSRAPR